MEWTHPSKPLLWNDDAIEDMIHDMKIIQSTSFNLREHFDMQDITALSNDVLLRLMSPCLVGLLKEIVCFQPSNGVELLGRDIMQKIANVYGEVGQYIPR